MVKRATLYKVERQGKYLIHALGKIEMGGSIPIHPFIWIDFDQPIDELIRGLRLALSMQRNVLPNPINWDVQEKEFLNNIGLKSSKELNRGSKLISVNLEDNILTFSASVNLGKNGFSGIKGKIVSVNNSADLEEIAAALENAFALCE